MKNQKLLIIIIIAILAIAVAIFGGYRFGIYRGYRFGHNEGYQSGYKEGTIRGEAIGCKKCKAVEPLSKIEKIDVRTLAKILDDPKGQWAITASASSSYSPDRWSSQQATGEPDVFNYGDNPNAWAPLYRGIDPELTERDAVQTLSLFFERPVYATGLRIRETYGSGTIIKVELIEPNGIFHTLWEGEDLTTGLDFFEIKIERTSYKVDGVKITFDITKSPPYEWAEIDAVQLLGEGSD